jgi:Phage integrase family
VWTAGRVEEWERTGERPSVAVWTADQLTTFLNTVTEDALFALWWLTALRGLRRGEACGLRWSELDLEHGVLFVVRNRTTAGYQVVEGEPKTAAGRRSVALDRRTVKVLREHRRRQAQQRERRIAAGKVWHDSGYVFVGKEGNPLHPGYASGRFRLLVKRAAVPPVRLHDLRHGAASPAHEAGADLKTLQDLLGHSSIVITADTYTSVLPVAQRKCADATAKLVLAADRRTREKIRGNGRRNRRKQRPAKGAPTPARPAKAKKPQVNPPITGKLPQTVMAPSPHPRDTHSPQQTRQRSGLPTFPQVNRLLILCARRDSNP